MNRREVLGMGSVGVLALALAGRFALTHDAAAAPDGVFPIRHTDAEWRKMLPPASYTVLRQAGTEQPFTSPLLGNTAKVFSTAWAVQRLRTVPKPSTTATPAGPVFGRFWIMQ